jgi:hypothetical protein
MDAGNGARTIVLLSVYVKSVYQQLKLVSAAVLVP